MSREEFSRFARNLDLDAVYPSLQALNFKARVPGRDLAAFVACQRRGNSGSAVRGLAPGSEHWVITDIEPAAANAAALGVDTRGRVASVAAHERARDTGAPSSTGRIELVQETMSQPVSSSPPPSTAAACRWPASPSAAPRRRAG